MLLKKKKKIVTNSLLKNPKKKKLGKAILTVAIADITLSLDNVLGVAGAAKSHFWALVTGLILSIFIMIILANIISYYIKKYKWLAWIGLFTILWVAIDLIYSETKILFF